MAEDATMAEALTESADVDTAAADLSLRTPEGHDRAPRRARSNPRPLPVFGPVIVTDGHRFCMSVLRQQVYRYQQGLVDGNPVRRVLVPVTRYHGLSVVCQRCHEQRKECLPVSDACAPPVAARC